MATSDPTSDSNAIGIDFMRTEISLGLAARLVTLFDEASPTNILAGEIREFFRKWCARRDSNAGPPA